MELCTIELVVRIVWWGFGREEGFYPVNFNGLGELVSDPKRPVQTIVRTMGRQSGQSGRGFQKPGSVRPKPGKPADAQAKPTDAQAKPTDVLAKPPDAQVKPADAQVKPADAQAKPPDAQVKPPDPGQCRQIPQQRVLLA